MMYTNKDVLKSHATNWARTYRDFVALDGTALLTVWLGDEVFIRAESD